ncbi:hypothetical protein [Cellulomonas sp. Marseille-Q8402]
MSVVVEVAVVSDTGARLRSVAQGVPDPVRVPGESAGSTVVDESVHDFLTSLGHCLVGAATAVYALGQDAVGAAEAFVEADRGLLVGSA